ncbi:MAG: ABC transporter permease [Vicinamibacterales bacterium]
MFATVVQLGLFSLLRNRLRASLTVLGIGIGIAAVICTAALGAAGATTVQQQIDALGEDFLWIRAASRNVAGVRTGFGGARPARSEWVDIRSPSSASWRAAAPTPEGWTATMSSSCP